jgi:2'-5' RNA ligase
LVLLGEDRPTLIAFRRELGTALKLRSSGFTPHITLMRGPTAVEEQQIEALRWTVDDFAFVHSVDGRYVELGRWKLTPPAAS